MIQKIFFIFLLIFLVSFLIFSQICLAEVIPEEIENYLVLPKRDTEFIFGTLIQKLTDKWVEITASPYLSSQEQAILVIIKRGVQVKALNYAFFQLPQEVGADLIKAIYKTAVFIYSPDKISFLLDEFEKFTVEEAKRYAMEWLLQKEIRASTGNLKLSYPACRGGWRDVIFPYIIVYQPLDSKKAKVGIEIYSSKPIDPPLPTWQYPWEGTCEDMLPPFIIQIQGKVEKGESGDYQWIEGPTFKIEFPEYVPEFEFEEPSFIDKINQDVKEKVKILENIVEGLRNFGKGVIEETKDLFNKGKDLAGNFFDWIKSAIERYNPFGAKIAPFSLEEIEITPPTTEKETPTKEELPGEEEEKEILEEPEESKSDLDRMQEQLDDIAEQIDIISQRVAKLLIASGKGVVLGETTKEAEEIVEEEEEEEEEEELEEELPETLELCERENAGFPKRNKVIINEVAWMGTKNSASDEWIELKNVTNASIDLSGWQLLDKKNQIKIIFSQNDIIPANSFYLLERTDDSSVPWQNADLIYTGALSNSNEALYLFNEDCQLEDEVVASPDWPAGDSKEKRSMERSSDLGWYTSRGFFQGGIFGTPKAENSQPVEEIPEETGGGYSPPPSFCSQENLGQPLYFPVVINEVAWMGTEDLANDEWIELKNISESVVSLTSWQLLDKDLNIKIIFGSSDSIEPGGFYLLERTDDSSVPDVLADKIYTGGLTNEDESLRLFDQNCSLIDEVIASPDWPAGNKDERRTMERDQNLDWHTYTGEGQDGIFGTPKAENSQPSEEPEEPEEPEYPLLPQAIVINEVAWMGTIANWRDEWIELFNNTDEDINLTGWQLRSANGEFLIEFVSNPENKIEVKNSIIEAKGFYLLERKSDDVVTDILADLIYGNYGPDWNLSNDGEELELLDGEGGLIDKTNCEKDEEGNCKEWFAGKASPDFISMERISAEVSGLDPQNWADNNGETKNGLDAGNNPINGTPKAQNSVFQTLPPNPILDLAIDPQSSGNRAILDWTAPGDPDSPKEDLSYDIRYFFQTITEENWENAFQIDGEPLVEAVGSSQTFTVWPLNYERIYFFAIKTFDGENHSEISNIVSFQTSPAPGPFVWPQFQKDSQRSGRSLVLGPQSADNFQMIFENFVSDVVIGAEQMIYFGTNNGVHSLNPDLTQRWFFPQENISALAIGKDGTILAISGQKLIALDQLGNKLWEYNFSWEIPELKPVVFEDKIYVLNRCEGFTGFSLFAFDIDGNLEWVFDTEAETLHQTPQFSCSFKGSFEGHYHSSPAVSPDGTICFGDKKDLYAINSNGSLKWKTSFETDRIGTPSIGQDGTIYVLTDRLLALNPGDGQILWESVGIKGDFGPAIAGDGTLYITGIGGGCARLYAIDPSDPVNPLWAKELGSSLSASLLSQNLLFVADNYSGSSIIRAFDFEGNEIWLPPWDTLPGLFTKGLTLSSNGILFIPGQKLIAISP